MGPFGIADDFRAPHAAKCPYHQSAGESWSYSLSVRLLPIVQRTVEITFAAKFGAGGGSIGTSLRYFGTVERLKSPAFQLFDDFSDRCASRVAGPLEGQLFHTISRNGCGFYFDWDLKLLEAEIPELCRKLSQLLSTGRSSASYSDEYGNTLLHAIFTLIGYLGSHFHHFRDQLHNLAKLVIDAGVQVDAVSRGLAQGGKNDLMIFGPIVSPSTTIFDIATNIAMQIPPPIAFFPLHEIIEEFLDDQASGISLDLELWKTDLARRSFLLNFLRRYPQLLSYFGYGQLEEAIACRSLSQMNHILQKKEYSTQHVEETSFKRLSHVELAIGWPSGLKRLLDVGFNADVGLLLSIHMDDLRSTKVIIAAENFPREKDTWTQVLGGLSKSSRKIEQVVIQTFSRRRQALAELAIKELSDEAIFRLGLLNEKSLDAAAPGVYQELQKRSVKIPQNLNSASSYRSIYHCLFDFSSSKPPDRRLLHSFYISGFELVDTLDAQGQTPLLLACKKFAGLFWTRRKVLSIRWLLDKGACPDFSCADSYPNVLFYIATSYAWSLRSVSKDFFKNFKPSIRHAASLCDPLCSDGCQCYCSSAGCLPFYKFWKCDAISFGHGACKSVTSVTLFDALHQWFCLCGIDKAQSEFCYEEVFRLEVFDRLGMAHTCCGYQRSSMDKKDRIQLQEEDTELKEQLDLIIQAYRNRYKKHAGGLNDFWKIFMQELNEILPELIPEDRCRHRCLSFLDYLRYERSTEYPEKEREWHDFRVEMEEEALSKRNYLGLDFIDIIHDHFADSLEPRSSDPSGNLFESIESPSET